jgi:hypothetical protein
MKTRWIALAAAAVVVTGGASAWVGAQAPAKPKVVQVAANTTPAPAARRAAPAAAAPVDSARPSEEERPASEVLITRETYAYPAAGRRDPFVSLMNTEELRPLLSDLKLVAVAFDPSGRNSVAVLRDMSSKEQYRVKVGQVIGRMRVASIREKNVVFGIEEFGYSRQETLAISDSTKVRMQ